MAAFYGNEQFPRRVVELLRDRGHNVLTVQEADNRGLSDAAVIVCYGRKSRGFDAESKGLYQATSSKW